MRWFNHRLTNLTCLRGRALLVRLVAHLYRLFKCLSSGTACLPTSYLPYTNFDTDAYNTHKLSDSAITCSVSQSYPSPCLPTDKVHRGKTVDRRLSTMSTSVFTREKTGTASRVTQASHTRAICSQ